jgi:hypothetical protein
MRGRKKGTKSPRTSGFSTILTFIEVAMKADSNSIASRSPRLSQPINSPIDFHEHTWLDMNAMPFVSLFICHIR